MEAGRGWLPTVVVGAKRCNELIAWQCFASTLGVVFDRENQFLIRHTGKTYCHLVTTSVPFSSAAPKKFASNKVNLIWKTTQLWGNKQRDDDDYVNGDQIRPNWHMCCSKRKSRGWHQSRQACSTVCTAETVFETAKTEAKWVPRALLVCRCRRSTSRWQAPQAQVDMSTRVCKCGATTGNSPCGAIPFSGRFFFVSNWRHFQKQLFTSS